MRCIFLALITSLALFAPATPFQQPFTPKAKYSARHHHKHHRSRYTGYVVSGRTSTFGYLTGDSEGSTADGGTTARPCIAIRDDSKLDHWFSVTVLGRRAKLLACDWGPAAFTGRAIDITGLGDRALGFSPTNYPTEAFGVARELR